MCRRSCWRTTCASFARDHSEGSPSEIEVIAADLHANSVAVFGTEVDRLVDTARAALERDLHVWIQPRLYDATQAGTLAHLARTAREAERLREEYSDVTSTWASSRASSLPGSSPASGGGSASTSSAGADRLPVAPAPVERVPRARSHRRQGELRGRDHVSAGPWEAEGIDWRQFDFVGLDYYAFHPTRKEHAREPKQAFVALAERYGAAG